MASQSTLPWIHVTFTSFQREYRVRLLLIIVNHDVTIEVDWPVEVGATLEPLAVAWYGVKQSGFKKGQTALIIGAGPVCHLGHLRCRVLTTALDRIVSPQSFTVWVLFSVLEDWAHLCTIMKVDWSFNYHRCFRTSTRSPPVCAGSWRYHCHWSFCLCLRELWSYHNCGSSNEGHKWYWCRRRLRRCW